MIKDQKDRGPYLTLDEVQALEEAVYLLNPTDEDMQKKAGVYRVVTALEKLKEKINGIKDQS